MMSLLRSWVSEIELEFLLVSGFATVMFAVVCTFV